MTLDIFNDAKDLQNKFEEFNLHHKQMRSLENYSAALPLKEKCYLVLIKRCMADGFLDEEAATFLNYMIRKHFSGRNFLNWAHRTPWLKAQMKALEAHYTPQQIQQMDMFQAPKERSLFVPSVPVELLAQIAPKGIHARL